LEGQPEHWFCGTGRACVLTSVRATCGHWAPRKFKDIELPATANHSSVANNTSVPARCAFTVHSRQDSSWDVGRMCLYMKSCGWMLGRVRALRAQGGAQRVLQRATSKDRRQPSRDHSQHRGVAPPGSHDSGRGWAHRGVELRELGPRGRGAAGAQRWVRLGRPLHLAACRPGGRERKSQQ
jgi:hypothetical protein